MEQPGEITDQEAFRRWRRIVEEEARELALLMPVYHANIQIELQQQWDEASFLGKIGLWLAGDMPEHANWRK